MKADVKVEEEYMDMEEEEEEDVEIMSKVTGLDFHLCPR